jgi:hypothetical protein
MYAQAWFDGNWTNWSTFPNDPIGRYHNPGVSGSGLVDPYQAPYLYVTYDDYGGTKNDILMLPYSQGGFFDEQRVPASIGPDSYGAQVSAEVSVGEPDWHKVHIVWEAIHEPIAHTDGGGTWGDEDLPPQQRKVMYQEYVNMFWTAAHEFRSGEASVSYHRPTVATRSSPETILMAWDDGSSTYKAMSYGRDWAVTEVYAASINPSYGEPGVTGPLTSSRFLSTSTTGPPYRLQPGSEEGLVLSRPLAALYSRRAEAAEVSKGDEDTTACLGLELSRITLKMSDGTIMPVDFVTVNDTMPGSNENTIWTQLSTVGVRVTSSIDSVFVEGTVSARALPRIRANGADGHRLLFDLVDARTGEVIGRVGGERLFTADGKYALRERAKVMDLTGRDVLIRPSLRGMVKGRPDMVYTIVHVHTLVRDSSGEALDLAAKSQAEGIVRNDQVIADEVSSMLSLFSRRPSTLVDCRLFFQLGRRGSLQLCRPHTDCVRQLLEYLTAGLA